jgi:hypothetical protein
VQAFDVDASGAIVGLDLDPYGHAQQALDAGAHIQSNSWGDFTGPTSDPEGQFGGYPLRSQRYDAFLWDNPGLLACSPPATPAPPTTGASSPTWWPPARTSSARDRTRQGPVRSGPRTRPTPTTSTTAGTATAAAVASGAAALAREWLQSRGTASPSGALLKSLLIGTARDIAPGQYGTGPTREVPSTRPNAVAGWGRLDLRPLAAPPPSRIWYDDHAAGLDTGGAVSYADMPATPLVVVDGSQPLVVTLVWTDPPASLSVVTTLVNDLDLEVVGPGGTTYSATGSRPATASTTWKASSSGTRRRAPTSLRYAGSTWPWPASPTRWSCAVA